jgi:hypothetical protein
VLFALATQRRHPRPPLSKEDFRRTSVKPSVVI